MRLKPNIISTDSLVLSPLSDNDYLSMIDLFTNEEIKKTYMIKDLISEEEKKRYFNIIKEYTLSKEHYAYGIYKDNSLIGFINDVEINDGEIELGYFISPKEWNHGYASEALKAMINMLFKLGFKKVICGHFIENPISGRVMQKCGMTLIDKKDVIHYHDIDHEVIYYMIERE